MHVLHCAFLLLFFLLSHLLILNIYFYVCVLILNLELIKRHLSYAYESAYNHTKNCTLKIVINVIILQGIQLAPVNRLSNDL